MSASSRYLAFALAAYLLRGRLRFPDRLPPVAGYAIPAGFTGVGVAAAEDPAVDDYLIARLDELGLRHVRLDFSYGDSAGPPGRLLEALLCRSFRVMLHLVQPFAAAHRMPAEDVAAEWRDFVVDTLDRYGERIESIEVGTTVNRRRWAGHSIEGFLALWEIAHREIRARGLLLAGPNVTDFEPPYNIGLLALLQRRGVLPDVHTDNLFSERCTEPERYDHKVFGRWLAPLLRVNLVAKARCLQKIGRDFGVPRLWSPAAFWTLPRIARMLPASEEKQADYLARYWVLCAASGALERAWWGPLLCQREGLIDNGEPGYPALERITHYTNPAGALEKFRIRPAFQALRTLNTLLADSRYEGRLNTGRALEVHAFSTPHEQIHALWTLNGRAAALADIYPAADLQSARFLTRDGAVLEAGPSLVGEAPLYACWPHTCKIGINAAADVLKDLAIDWHAAGHTHFLFREDGWQGVIRARDADAAAKLLAAIHPARMGVGPPSPGTVLRHARNAVWTLPDPRQEGARLVVKQPVKMHFHKKLFDRFKPSKALRSWNGTCELLRRGIAAAPPIAYFEKVGAGGTMQNYYLCEHVPAEFTARELLSAYASGATHYQGIEAVEAYRQLSDYLLSLHGRGIFFRDLSGGNLLIRKTGDGTLAFCLIDTGRIHAFNRPLPLGKRLADLVRICNKLHWAGRITFMGLYMAGLGRPFAFHHRLPFYLYDLKVTLKRNAARKWLRRQWQHFSP